MNKIITSLLVLLLSTALAGAQATPQEAFIHAESLYQSGQYDVAKTAFLEFLGSHSGSGQVPEAYMYLARLESDPEVAVQYHRKVVDEYPLSDAADDALLGLAQYDYAMSDYQAAADRYQQLIRDYPSSDLAPEASFWSANSYYMMGNLSRAEELYNETINRYPNDEKASWSLLDVAYNIYQQQGDCNSAISKYEMLFERFPQSNVISAAYYRYGECLEEVGREREALLAYQYVIENFPTSFEGAMVRGKELDFSVLSQPHVVAGDSPAEPVDEPPVAEAVDITPTDEEIAEEPAAALDVDTPASNPSETTDTEEPIAANDTEGNFYIQIGAYSNADNAELLKSTIEDDQFRVTIIQVDMGSRVLYRVWVGGYRTHAAAEQAAQALVDTKGIRNYIIVSEQ